MTNDDELQQSNKSHPYPLLAAWSAEYHNPHLQPFLSDRSNLPLNFRTVAHDCLARATRVVSSGTGSNCLQALTLHLKPCKVTNIIRAPQHRPAQSTYVAAFHNHFSHILSPQQNPLPFDPRSKLAQHFTTANKAADIVLNPVFDDEGRMAHLSEKILGPCVQTVQKLRPRRATVWIYYTNDSVSSPSLPSSSSAPSPNDCNVSFRCIAGWARWTALRAALEDATHAVEKEEGAVLLPEYLADARDFTVPVYILDGNCLSDADVVMLSYLFNFLDRDQEDNLIRCSLSSSSSSSATVGGVETPAEVVNAQSKLPPLDKICSRPISLGDRVWCISTALDIFMRQSTFLSVQDGEFLKVFLYFIEHTVQFSDLFMWLKEEAERLLKSNWMNIPMAIFPLTKESANAEDAACHLLAFIVGLPWPIDSRKLHGMNVKTLLEFIGADGFLTGGPSSSPSNSQLLYWDELLHKQFPYQVQLLYSLGDLVSLVRLFETFFLTRSAMTVMPVADFRWSLNDNHSLLKHFLRKGGSAAEFVWRVITSEKVRAVEGKEMGWAFDSLASFICFYNLHFLMECERHTGKPGETYSQTIPADSPILLPAGAARVLNHMRAMIIMGYLTFDNPALLLELVRTQIPESAMGQRAPLNLPPAKSATVHPIFTLFLDPALKNRETLELSFEALLGALSELLFRMCVAGFFRLDTFPLLPTPTPIAPFDYRSMQLDTPRAKRHLLNSALKTGALILQSFFREVSNPGQPVTAMVPTEPRSHVYQSVVTNSIGMGRRRGYEHVCMVGRIGSDVLQAPPYALIFRYMDGVYRSGPFEAHARAHGILTGAEVIIPDATHTLSGDQRPPSLRVSADNTPALPSPEAQNRIARWFEDRRSEARDFLSFIYENAANPQKPFKIVMDFRNKSPEEARLIAGPSSDLAIESTNLQASLAEIPYHFLIEEVKDFPFTEMSLKAVLNFADPIVQTGFEMCLQTLTQARADKRALPGHVVVSARPIIVCILWQSLARISPFFDILHPLATDWHRVRARFCSYLWGEARAHYERRWAEVLSDWSAIKPEAQPFGEGSSSPQIKPESPPDRSTVGDLPIKFSLSRIAGETEGGSVQDLTVERLGNLLMGPRALDRICSAYYRFQCSGMANARAALGSGIAAARFMTANDLEKVFVSAEPCMRSLFCNIFSQYNPQACAEDVIAQPELAAAGFLKRYAPYVLSGLEVQEKNLDAVRIAQERDRFLQNDGYIHQQAETGGNILLIDEPSAKRRRKDNAHPDRRRSPDDIMTASVAATHAAMALRATTNVSSRRRAGLIEADLLAGAELSNQRLERYLKELSEDDTREWLALLPLALRQKLAYPVSGSSVYDEVESAFRALPRNLQAMDSRRRRRRGSGVGATEDVVSPESLPSQTEIWRPHQSMKCNFNGTFPTLPQWLENTPVGELWAPLAKLAWDENQFKTKPGWSLVSSFPDSAPTSTSILHGTAFGEIDEPDWQLIKSVLHSLAQRGIDGLYSSAAGRTFNLSVYGAHQNSSVKEQWTGVEEGAPGEGLKRPADPGDNERRGCLVQLRHFLSGYSAASRSIINNEDGMEEEMHTHSTMLHPDEEENTSAQLTSALLS